MGNWIQSGDDFSIAPSSDSLLTGLPVGVYTIQATPQGVFFNKGADMPAAGRIYGEHEKWADRVMTTFQDRASSTGVLLTGTKGSGKSLLGRLLVERCRELAMPCIVIDKTLDGSVIGSMLNNLQEPAIILFDEFDKYFREKEDQEKMLSLFDGTSSVRHLFVITANDKLSLSKYLINRPGRLYYNIDFTGLSEAFIKEYAQENLENSKSLDGLIHVTSALGEVSFDQLAALIHEMNRYDESAQDSVKLLNLSPSRVDRVYSVEVFVDGVAKYVGDSYSGSPLTTSEYIYYYDSKEDKEGDQLTEGYFSVSKKHLVNFDSKAKTMIFEYENERLILTEQPASAAFDYFAH